MNMTLKDLFDAIDSTDIEDTKLFLITRAVKPHVAKRSPAIERYLFNVHQVDSRKDVRETLLTSSKEYLEKVIEKGYEMMDYDVLAEESEHLFSYPIKNKVFSFSDIIMNKLGKTNIPKVKNLSDIETETESLWAYCFGFETSIGWIYTFRKITNSQVGVPHKENPEKNILSRGLRMAFDSESMKLELLKKETLTFDKNIDCVYHDETFYIIKKGNFESLVGLQEHFKEEAIRIANSMNETTYIEISEEIKSLIEKRPSTHKKFIKVEKTGVYKDLTPQKIKKMATICKKFGEKLPLENGHLVVKSEKDLDVILKMCSDYHKKAEFSGKVYGTFSGKEIKPSAE